MHSHGIVGLGDSDVGGMKQVGFRPKPVVKILAEEPTVILEHLERTPCDVVVKLVDSIQQRLRFD
jgi:hypothetical protein